MSAPKSAESHGTNFGGRYPDWCVLVPMANEEPDFEPFALALTGVLDLLESGRVYLVVDNASRDQTRALCEGLSTTDARFQTIWAPDNRNVVDAYLSGFRAALQGGHEIIIEMDAGLSHDPRAIPMFLRVLNEGNECAFGSRYINGGSMADSPFSRRFLSKAGSILARILLGAQLSDMTSGYQAFHAPVLRRLMQFPLQSKAHFYQTEVRHLLRHTRLIEVPIHYRAPSPRVSQGAIKDSMLTLLHYTKLRILGRSPSV